MKRLTMLASAALLALTATASAEADLKKGEKVFKKCKACHAVGEKAKNKVGPQLNGIMDREWGTVEGFKYSKALLAMAEGKVWDTASMDEFLTKPKKFIPKTKMAFAGLKKEADRENVIAYLAQFNADGTTK